MYYFELKGATVKDGPFEQAGFIVAECFDEAYEKLKQTYINSEISILKYACDSINGKNGILGYADMEEIYAIWYNEQMSY